MTASAAQQRKVVRDFKYPKLDESAAQQKYYREARMAISVYHKGTRAPTWLLEKAAELQALVQLQSTARSRQRLSNNARAVRSYHDNFRNERFEVLDRQLLYYDSGDVRVKVTPDLHVLEKEVEKIIKLEFSADEPTDDLINIICQVMYEAANDNGVSFPSSSVLYCDVRRGRVFKGARAKTRMIANIRASCETIKNIWDSL